MKHPKRGSLRDFIGLLVVSLGIAMGVAAPAAAGQDGSKQSPGVLEGRVTDGATGEALPGAKVMVADTVAETSTDREGLYRLASVPAGDHSIIVTYLGRQDVIVNATVVAGASRRMDVTMNLAGFEETVTVRAELILGAQERALNQQKTAPNITNIVSADQIGSFPDRNAAETTQRIPGVSITKDQGEGRYVSIRGTDPRLNSMMIDGERIPAPDPLLRQVAVDVVPSELLQAIEVSKAPTPDMDGDAIGGSVNLVMKQAPSKFRLFGAFGGGYNQMLENYRQNNGSVTAGGRTNSGRIGIIASASASETNRGNQDVEVVYTPVLGLNELNPRYYQVNRKRVGFTGALDFKPDNESSLTVRGVFNRFIDDHENRQRVRDAVANSRIDRELRDRTHIERITSLGLSGQRIVRQSTTVDYQLLGAYSDQFDPLTMTTTFRETRVTFNPNVSAASIDPDNIQANPVNDNPANYNFLQQLNAINFAKDRDIVASVNMRTPLMSSAASATAVKFGVKYRDKQKGRDRNENTFTTSSTLKMTDFLETGFNLPPYLDGRYDLTPYLKQSAVAGIPSLATGTSVRNHARDAEEFDGSERTTAAYALAEINASAKLFLLPGLRYEYTAEDFVGRNVRFAANGAWLGTDPIGAKANYGTVLPGFHVRYAATPNTNLRVAVTRSLARPNYYDAVPYRAQDDNAATIALGNVDLRPTHSWNIDVMGEHYFRSVGVLSAGVFYKNLADYIYMFTTQQNIGGVQYQVTQPLNGDTATVRGVEIALQNQLKFLPGPFKGLGVYANYTFTDSTAAIPGHEGARLPGQAPHVGNLAASYELRGFSGRVAVNFHGSYLDVVGATNALDRYYDTNSQLDLSFNQKLTHNLRVYLDWLNVNNALLRYYQGVPDRPLQEEHYQAWLNFGVKVEF